MKRIIFHWTGGSNYPNSADLQHYHFLIDKDGKLYKGKFPVSSNAVCKTDQFGHALYAAHTGGGNTGSIGVAVCGMANFNGKLSSTKFPLTAIQLEKMFSVGAKLCKQYAIPISPDTVLTHYEFGRAYPKTTSHGKIDISFLPPYLSLKSDEVGIFIRNKVLWYLKKTNNSVNRKIH